MVELLDSSTGLVAASYQYDPWGNPTSSTGPAANVSPFRWQSEFYDASFGGYYMGAREGSARLHIFLSPDPSGEGSDPNLYRMVGNDPINVADPTGTTGVNMDAYRQSTQVWNEAKQQIQNSTGLSPSTPWNQMVPGTGIFGFNQKTYGDLVTSAYKDKVAWYDHGQGNVFFSGPSVQVVSDAEYARKQEIANQPPTIGPEQLTPEQQQRQRTAQYWQAEVDANRAVPEAAQARWLLVEADGDLFYALHAALKAKTPDLLMALAAVPEPKVEIQQGSTGFEWVRPSTSWRLPQTQGQWSGTPGDSFWKSDIPVINRITGNKPIPFNNGYIDLSYYTSAEYRFDNLTGTKSDANLGDAELARDFKFNSPSAARAWRKRNGLVWHHLEDGETLQLVPRPLNDIPHQGGASMLRGQ